MKKLVPQSIKNIYHLFQAVLANLIYGFPSKNIKVIGVTGTNGKTTTVQMITKILEESEKKVAMASTINFKLGEKEWVNATKFTTLSSFKVQKFIKEAVKTGCEYLVLETSSHSLDQFRTWGIKYDTAVITNITREHLDYHKTMEEYRRAKLKLFKNARVVVVNLDMEKPQNFIKFGEENIFGYTMENQKSKIKNQNDNIKFKIIQAKDIELGIDYAKYKISAQGGPAFGWQDTNFRLNLLGKFNIENALAGTCVGLAYGISLETIKNALEKIKGVPGRMERVPNDEGIEIIIDYAVTPDSLEKVYSLISQSKKENAKIISVFGSCGERDRGKRPIMGEIVSRYADYIILTNEDPYGEDPEQIIGEVESGIKKHELGKNYWIIMDRREAIKKALQIAKPGDIFVITGKGAEEVMAIGEKRIPWNEKKVIQEVLQELV
ncbi:MAG TPA: UDP-N-acetylmuramoyl-L-alanyl-D-glutamate--2,6-diaminopimelate ligase [Candidatus Moranbacteria bacterium]|nr:UDP-N-acetylmuramoyl-L-alanyl-D-glutamate--2,6-diaminopimelate ligase [Candidatus Moranbacteria bacterium]